MLKKAMSKTRQGRLCCWCWRRQKSGRTAELFTVFLLLILGAFSLSGCTLSSLSSYAPGEQYITYAATTYETTIDGLTYRVHADGVAALAHADGDVVEGALSIPSSIQAKDKTLPVTLLEDACLANCPNLRSVTFPSTVTEARSTIFFNTPVTEVKLNEGLTALNGTFNGADKLKTIELPSTLELIGDHCFEGCSSLEQINIPDKVHTIGVKAFCGCTSLSRCELPNSLLTIASKAFNTGAAITVTVPFSCTKIETEAFDSKTATLVVKQSSYAYRYAKARNITFVYAEQYEQNKKDEQEEQDARSGSDEQDAQSGRNSGWARL